MSAISGAGRGSGFLVLGVMTAFARSNGALGGGETDTRPQVLQIQAKELWTAPGTRVPDGLLVVRDGRIQSIGHARDADLSQALIRHDGIVTAGLIACRAQLGTGNDLQDDTRSVLPRALASHAIDPTSRDFERALAAGITTIGIAPGPESLVGGLACAVKTAGGRVVAPETALTISLTAAALGRSTARGGFLFGVAEEEGGRARPAGGPETTSHSTRGTREPTSFPGAIETLGRLLDRGQGAFGRAKRGELPVVIEAWDRHEVLRAVEFARAHGLKGAIRGAPLAGDPDVLAVLQASELGVIVGPYSAQQTRRSLESLALLSKAGVPVGFALDAPVDSTEDLRLAAVRAMLAGATREMAWRALTADAALLTGVVDSTGALKPGLEADFVLWSGDPLDLTSQVVAVYVDGAPAWPKPAGH